MALQVIVIDDTGQVRAWSIGRMTTGDDYDWNDNTFKSVPTTPTAVLTEGTGFKLRRYRGTIPSPSVDVFTNGWYEYRIHDGLSGPCLTSVPIYVQDQSDLTAPFGSKAQGAYFDLTQPTPRPSGSPASTLGWIFHALFGNYFGYGRKNPNTKRVSVYAGPPASNDPIFTKQYDSLTSPTTEDPV